jgi:N,N'-diacetyllegionaminate synthase
MSVEIVAEVAQGYEGNAVLAQLLARAAVRAGADAVKFQLVYADEIATPGYQYYDLFRNLEMPQEVWRTVVKEAKGGGARLYFDVYGERSLREAVELGVDGVKIHTTDFFNSRLVRSALDMARRVYVSLGGISAEELKEFLAYYDITPDLDVCLMYGFQAEPTPIESNNLRRLGTLRALFPGYRLGFMDHTDGNIDDAMTLALMTLSFGVDCIEKHISLDRNLELEDYVSALSPEKFQVFVQRIRHHEKALGMDSLELTSVEREYRHKTMKVVVASRKLKQGDVVTVEDVCLKRASRPDQTSSIHRMEEVVGRSVSVDIEPDEQITRKILL